MKEKTALYTGTFDPFTIGHQNIVERVLPLFDRLVIGVAESRLKHTRQTVDERVAAIRELYNKNAHVRVVGYSDLTIDLARREHVTAIVRGVRSVQDYEYERGQATFNRQWGGIETLLLFADPSLEAVSSTLVRELEHFGKDTSRLRPFPFKEDDPCKP